MVWCGVDGFSYMTAGLCSYMVESVRVRLVAFHFSINSNYSVTPARMVLEYVVEKGLVIYYGSAAVCVTNMQYCNECSPMNAITLVMAALWPDFELSGCIFRPV